MIHILYASTSGSTKAVAEIIAGRFPGRIAILADIRRLSTDFLAEAPGFVFLGTPSYGIGDCHSAWHELGPHILCRIGRDMPVALFGLADARGHGRSFAGGIGRLYDMALAAGLTPVGDVAADSYMFDDSPALRAGRFPGMVVEYRRDRHRAARDIARWAASVVGDAEAQSTEALESV